MSSNDDKVSESDQSLIDTIVQEDSHLPLLPLINTFGGKEEDTKRFCGNLESIRQDLELRLQLLLENRISSTVNAFLQVENLQHQVNDLTENEQYFRQSVQDTQVTLAKSMEDHAKLTTAGKNLSECMKEVRRCLEMAESFKKIEDLTVAKDFYTAALTLDRLKSRIESCQREYQFLKRMSFELHTLTDRIFEESLNTLGHFLKVTSEKIVEVGQEVVEKNWECDLGKLIDFGELASCYFVAQLFHYESDFIMFCEEEFRSLVDLICDRRYSKGIEGFKTFTYSLIGFFACQVRATYISSQLANHIQQYWKRAILKVEQKIRSEVECAKSCLDQPIAEEMIIMVSEIVKFFQYYGLESPVLQSGLECLFARFCEESIHKAQGSNDPSQTTSERNFLQQAFNIFENIKKPEFESDRLNQGKLDDFWKLNRNLFLASFLQNYLHDILNAKIRKRESLAQELNHMRTELQESTETLETIDTLIGREELITMFESIGECVLEEQVKVKLDQLSKETKSVLDASDSIWLLLDENSENSFPQVLNWFLAQTSQLQSFPKLRAEVSNVYIEQTEEIISKIIRLSGKLDFATLEQLSAHLHNFAKVQTNLNPDSFAGENLTNNMLSLVDAALNSDDAAKLAQAFQKIAQGDSPQLSALQWFKMIRMNSQQDKEYSKTPKGKNQLKLSASMLKKLEKSK